MGNKEFDKKKLGMRDVESTASLLISKLLIPNS